MIQFQDFKVTIDGGEDVNDDFSGGIYHDDVVQVLQPHLLIILYLKINHHLIDYKVLERNPRHY